MRLTRFLLTASLIAATTSSALAQVNYASSNNDRRVGNATVLTPFLGPNSIGIQNGLNNCLSVGTSGTIIVSSPGISMFSFTEVWMLIGLPASFAPVDITGDGTLWLNIDALASFLGSTNGGQARVTVKIPNDPAIAGFPWAWKGGVATNDPMAPRRYANSQGLLTTIEL